MALTGYPKTFIHPTVSIFELTGSRDAVTNIPTTQPVSNAGNYAVLKVHGGDSTDWIFLKLWFRSDLSKLIYLQPGTTIRGPLHKIQLLDEGDTTNYAGQLGTSVGSGDWSSGTGASLGTDRDIYITLHEVKEDA